MSSIKGGAAVLTAALLVLAGRTAQAATIEASVPFPFVVHGQSLPAGRYLVTDMGNGVVEIVGERGVRAGMYAMTVPAAGHDPAGKTPSLTFKRDETQYRLSSIWESGTVGRAIAGK